MLVMTTAAWQAFGAELRVARNLQHRSLNQVAQAIASSSSTIHRLEQGVAAGRQEIIRALDALYGAEGHLTDKYGRLMYPTWVANGGALRMTEQHARSTWQHTFPNAHSGDVWILVRPTTGRSDKPLRVELRWGPWLRTVTVSELTSEGVSLLTGKSRDDVAVPLHVTVEPAAHLLFGTDDEAMQLTHTQKIHTGWRLVDETREKRSVHRELVDALYSAEGRAVAGTPDGRRLGLARQALSELSVEAQHILETVLRERKF
ncbi:helix-turn-helix domain-containing protein [Lapillicoccus jejuensis]|uniref:helix-turn-helix domain-containing protein n=1 Tax=Lapillicoccus jejuensis TaxID=402171 RepID=UPI0011521CD5